MNYTISELAELSGVTARTLRYYDQIDLLKPARIQSNGYRRYGQAEVDRLQQILFYRELEFPLDTIKKILKADDFNRVDALQGHLLALQNKQEQIEMLITNVKKTICSIQGGTQMQDKEKFEGFKKQLIADNEQQYGREIRPKYGDDAVNQVNENIMGLSPQAFEAQQALEKEILDTLAGAMADGNPAGKQAQKCCQLHRDWICIFWGRKQYTPEKHLGLGRMYTADDRFRAYYEKAGQGAADFLYEALQVFCETDS